MPADPAPLRRKLLVATTNPGKIAELQAMLEGDVEWVGLTQFPLVGPIEEDGETFQENARKKALGYARATGLWTISDDSGLAVDALGGLPGVRSARFAGAKAPDRRAVDRANTDEVLRLLQDVPPSRRTARFVCCLCLASPEGVLLETSGTLEGRIAQEPAGDRGFGYDPIFLVPDLHKTVAQMEPGQKNAVSHRGCALRMLRPLLTRLVAPDRAS